MRDDNDGEELFAALNDDDKLLAALGEAIRAREAVPAWFVETGKNAYAWHNIDAELAKLTYDSRSDERIGAVTRSETASIRALTFTSAHMSMELEVTEDSLLGQIIPPRAGTLEIHTKADRGSQARRLIPSPLPHAGRRRRVDWMDHLVSSGYSPHPDL